MVIVDIDPSMTNLAKSNPIFLKLNNNALNDVRVRTMNEDAYTFLNNDNILYSAIIIDLPDPKTISIARLYTKQFYQLAVHHLIHGGILVTQATSPFFSQKAFISVLKTMRSVGIPAIAYHNHIPTMGEWGWVLGMNVPGLDSVILKKKLSNMDYSNIKTRFINREAMLSMLNFGKGVFDNMKKISINDEMNLIIYNYYKKGAWDIY